jgi:hypothetical protein
MSSTDQTKKLMSQPPLSKSFIKQSIYVIAASVLLFLSSWYFITVIQFVNAMFWLVYAGVLLVPLIIGILMITRHSLKTGKGVTKISRAFKMTVYFSLVLLVSMVGCELVYTPWTFASVCLLASALCVAGCYLQALKYNYQLCVETKQQEEVRDDAVISDRIVVVFITIIGLVGVFVVIMMQPGNREMWDGKYGVNKVDSISESESITAEEVMPFSNDELKLQLTFSSNPYVKYIRVAIDEYLTNIDNKTDGVPNSECGLSNFDDYLTGKFVAISMNDDSSDVKNMAIIFKDKPDKVFFVEVGRGSKGEYYLKSFCDSGYKENEIQILLKAYQLLLQNPGSYL